MNEEYQKASVTSAGEILADAGFDATIILAMSKGVIHNCHEGTSQAMITMMEVHKTRLVVESLTGLRGKPRYPHFGDIMAGKVKL